MVVSDESDCASGCFDVKITSIRDHSDVKMLMLGIIVSYLDGFDCGWKQTDLKQYSLFSIGCYREYRNRDD